MIFANIPTFPLFSMMQQSSTNSDIPFWIIPAVILVALVVILLLAIFDEEEHDDAHGDHADHGHADHGHGSEDDVVGAERAVTATAVLVEEEVVETAVEPVEEEVVETAVEPVEEEVVEEIVETAVVEPEPVVPDNLRKIEGIGPKISQILNDAGIFTFAQLAAATLPQLEKIVHEDAGLHIARPDTWPEQAQLAADENWDELEVLQDHLKGGRRVS